MPGLLAALVAFVREHQRGGDLDGGFPQHWHEGKVRGRMAKWLKVKQAKYREGERGWDRAATQSTLGLARADRGRQNF
jgi:hypothetical protein